MNNLADSTLGMLSWSCHLTAKTGQGSGRRCSRCTRPAWLPAAPSTATKVTALLSARRQTEAGPWRGRLGAPPASPRKPGVPVTPTSAPFLSDRSRTHGALPCSAQDRLLLILLDSGQWHRLWEAILGFLRTTSLGCRVSDCVCVCPEDRPATRPGNTASGL